MHKDIKSLKVRCHKLWSSYHTVRSSQRYIDEKKELLSNASIVSARYAAMIYQYVGHYMLKELMEPYHTTTSFSTVQHYDALTYEEINSLMYSAGYVPRAIKTKLQKEKTSPLMKDLLIYFDDMIDSEGVINNGSRDWLELVNRGGLTCINGLTFELFLAIELELRSHFQVLQQEDIIEPATSAIKSNEDVLFFWAILSAGWDETSATNLLDRIIHLWITIRGFPMQVHSLRGTKLHRKNLPKNQKASGNNCNKRMQCYTLIIVCMV